MYWWIVRAVLVGIAVPFIADDGWKWNPTVGAILLVFALFAGDAVVKYELRREEERG